MKSGASKNNVVKETGVAVNEQIEGEYDRFAE
jgi:hypothetical protein